MYSKGRAENNVKRSIRRDAAAVTKVQFNGKATSSPVYYPA
jgi:hypothetical protein